ncbi:D-glycerate dehydrogenase [Mesorhizobium sp. CA8]|uniref:2-hydroxyacid dehydrogenase n=1 Tax=unclassified Mesorhizobium TaxID=325217 RepID=UPI001CD007AC|nr:MULTISPECIES: D-glycerate dehydrogenase [unclassified Mesorhizobium]MBZ9765130.1 D-glycerate dehydrogenase [Mesorhizobium sp. CA8]MBZ9823471.1 D-glycerate dehydrogenase [Mesorhizobium sp. CA4]
MNPRVMVTRRWPAKVEKILTERFDAVLNADDVPLTTEDLATAFQTYDAILPTVSDRLPASVFPSDSCRTRLLANFGVGFSHIDVAAARQCDIAVTNTPGVLTDCTADIAMSLLLSVARRAGEGERQLRSGGWKGWCPTHLIGAKISGKKLGIIGMGRIGKAMARRAHFGFGMDVVFYNRSRVEDDVTRSMSARQLPSIEAVLAESDFVSLHCPGGADNKHLIDEARLSAMKPTAFLINTARGDVIDEIALIHALDMGTIAGAGLDVYAEEPAVPRGLLDRENVVLLPHLGSATAETREAMGMKALDNVTAFFEGRPAPDRVV